MRQDFRQELAPAMEYLQTLFLRDCQYIQCLCRNLDCDTIFWAVNPLEVPYDEYRWCHECNQECLIEDRRTSFQKAFARRVQKIDQSSIREELTRWMSKPAGN